MTEQEYLDIIHDAAEAGQRMKAERDAAIAALAEIQRIDDRPGINAYGRLAKSICIARNTLKTITTA